MLCYNETEQIYAMSPLFKTKVIANGLYIQL